MVGIGQIPILKVNSLPLHKMGAEAVKLAMYFQTQSFYLPSIIFLFFILIYSLLTSCTTSPQKQLTVSAAANLIPAFEEIGQAFEAETGIKVIYNFASSGNLAHQIKQGAPVDVFAAANTDYVTTLIDDNKIISTSYRIYALGQLVMWSNQPQLHLQTLNDLNTPIIQQIAIANPDHAPYGRVAQTLLQNNGLWTELQPKLIFGNDVRQTLTYAQTADVSVALVPLSLVINLQQGHYILISSSTPISQAIGITSTTTALKEAQLFVEFVLGEKGQTILEKYGYERVR